MMSRKRLCVGLGIAAILFLMLASQSIQRRHLLSLTFSSFTWATPTSQERAVDVTIPRVTQTHERPKGLPPANSSSKNLRSCGCTDGCISEMGTSSWFSQRYDPQLEPIVQETNNFDPEVIKWWRGLQSNGANTVDKVISDLFQIISPPTEDFKPRPSRCRTCAVVGNSGNLINSSFGPLINAHNFVIRMNRAVTEGYEKDVGNRTTHHVMYPESAKDLPKGVSLVLVPFKTMDMEWLISALTTGTIKVTYQRVKERVEADKDKMLVVSPMLIKYTHDRWNEHHGRYPSTGMLSLIFALHICDQVSVFGFGADKFGNWHHYFEVNHGKGAFRKTGIHSGDFEAELLKKLDSEGKIRLHVPPN